MKAVKELPKNVIQDSEFKRIFSDGEKVYTRIWVQGGPGKFEICEFEDMSSAKKHIKGHLTAYFKKKYEKITEPLQKELGSYN
jgi:hypothetical protein